MVEERRDNVPAAPAITTIIVATTTSEIGIHIQAGYKTIGLTAELFSIFEPLRQSLRSLERLGDHCKSESERKDKGREMHY
jgi:hypothetical protein